MESWILHEILADDVSGHDQVADMLADDNSCAALR